MRALVFDTETTGLLKPGAAKLEDQPKIIELAIIEIHSKDDGTGAFEFGDRHEWLIHPEELVTDEITKITGISNADLEGKPTFPEVLPEIVAVMLGADALAAHNLPFDIGMLVNDLKRCGKEHAFPYPPKQICTVVHFMHLRGRRMKLGELYKMICKKEMEVKHRAMADTQALAEICVTGEVFS